MTGFQYVLGAFCLAGLLVVSGVWIFQTYGVYRFDQSPQSPQAFGLTGVRVLSFASEDGAPVQAWLSMPEPGQPMLFSFYGNFAALGPAMKRLAPLMADGTGIVMLQYRGAGGLPGHPSEENFARDARALYDQLDALAGQTIPPERRVLHGFSLGAGVAVRLASERPVAGLVLEAAIPRLCLYFQRRYHGLPLCLLMWSERFDSRRRIGKVDAPMLFVHGTSDHTVPILWARQLYDRAGEPKEFVELKGASHTDLVQHGLIGLVRDFLRRTAE